MVEPAYIPAQEWDIEGIQGAAFESWHATYAEIFSLEKIASFLREGRVRGVGRYWCLVRELNGPG